MTTTKDKVCEFLLNQSHKVWHRINFARETNQRVSETTITENLLFEFWQASIYDRLPLKIFEAKAESKNGNDLELFIETDRGYLRMALQAKIGDRRNKYSAIYHKVGRHPQIDLLLDYARKNNAIPAYLFYNYVPDERLNDAFYHIRDHRQYGISYCDAKLIDILIKVGGMFKKPRIIPAFSDLHPFVAHPFHEIICGLLNSRFKAEEVPSLHFYGRDEIEFDDNWSRVLPPARIGYVSNMKDDGYEQESNKARQSDQRPNNRGFRPKFRIIISSGDQ